MSHSINIAANPHGATMPVVTAAQPKATGRLLFIDNIRTMLTIQVIVFHMLITYAGVGSWMYVEGRADFITTALGAWLIAVSQAYFMGLFLLISAYFVPGSYDRKGPKYFLQDRLMRLGIPLVIYSLLLQPLLIFIKRTYFDGQSWWGYFPGQYFRDEGVIGSGPLWFVETLLIFAALYVLWRLWMPRAASETHATSPFPSTAIIVIFTLLLGLGGFGVRVWLPIGWTFEPLNLQFPFFVQYIALFVIGLIAYRRNWFLSLPMQTGRRWLWSAIVAIFAFWLLFMVGGTDQGFAPYQGGLHWQALTYALWEAWLCVSMCIGLIYLFRRYGDHQGATAAFLSRNAYTAYIIHGPIITLLALTARDVMLHPLLKFALMSLVAAPLCFGLSACLIRQMPYTERVL